MKYYLKPFVLLLPIFLVTLYYLISLSNRSEFPENLEKNKIVMPAAFESLEFESFNDWKGQKISVKSSSAPIIIVHFWAAWCKPCIHEFPDLIKMAKLLKGQVQIFALSEDNAKEEINAFIKSFRDSETTDNFHIVWDQDHTVMNKWEVNKLPESYIYGPKRNLLKHVSGAVSWSSQDTIEYFQTILSKRGDKSK